MTPEGLRLREGMRQQFMEVIVRSPEDGTNTVSAEVTEDPQGINVRLHTDVILEKFGCGQE
jgi:hypothetical protein